MLQHALFIPKTEGDLRVRELERDHFVAAGTAAGTASGGAKAFIREHFEREFKKETGRAVNHYLTSLRIEKARELLAEFNVTDTAFRVGYNDSGYFGTVFKKYTGQRRWS